MEGKPVSHSEVVMSNLMLPQQANASGNVHGGEIMKMMDSTAGVVARRHSRTNVVTARVDELQFHLPIHIGNFVTCYGKLVFVGNSSMEVTVTVTVEDLAQNEPGQMALTAYFTLVALDERGKPVKVPPLILANEEERLLFAEGKRRYEAYKQLRKK
jgi:acyl-CoA hydrolase